MLIAIHGVKLYVHCYSWSEPFSHCYTYLVGSVMLGVKLHALCYTWSEVLC